ncbi:hypothetical protein EMGBS15_18320 [Filimonas sp.]|nr:hypothetical protein EMGBS15_18320 [Filimonas sp.]
MRLKILLFFFLFILLLQAKPLYADAVIGLQEAVSDTTSLSTEGRLAHVLQMHPMLNGSNVAATAFVRERISVNKTGVFLFAILLSFLFSLVRLIFPRYFLNLFQLFTGLSSSKRHIKDQLESDNRASLWYYILFFISTGFIVYQFVAVLSGMRFHPHWFVNYLVCTIMVLALLGFRTGMIRLTGWIFKRSDYVQIYLLNTKLANEFLGLILFPLCILILISSGKIQHNLLTLSGVLCILLFLYNYLRNIPVLRNLFRISFVHFLLYLCAFEVLPVLILIKMIR